MNVNENKLFGKSFFLGSLLVPYVRFNINHKGVLYRINRWIRNRIRNMRHRNLMQPIVISVLKNRSRVVIVEIKLALQMSG